MRLDHLLSKELYFLLAQRAGRWLVCADCLFLWVDGLLGHAVVRVRHHNHRVSISGGGWCVADTKCWGALVHCWVSGMAHVVVPGPAAGDCHGVWWLRVVWVCCVRTG